MLQIAIKAVNDTAGPDSLMPTLLVFSTYPRLSESDLLTPNITQRAIAIRRAIQEVVKLQAKRQVTDALCQQNSPKVDCIYDLAIGSDVLIWHIYEKAWTGPYRLISIDDETATIEVNGRSTSFRTIAVKLYLTGQTDDPTDNATADPADNPALVADATDDVTDNSTIVVQPETAT
jgi:hypothetical protein